MIARKYFESSYLSLLSIHGFFFSLLFLSLYNYFVSFHCFHSTSINRRRHMDSSAAHWRLEYLQMQIKTAWTEMPVS